MKEGQALQGSPYVEQIEKICKFAQTAFPYILELGGTQRRVFGEPILTGCLTG